MSCVAIGCKNRRSINNFGITYHRFPADETLKGQWIKALRRENWYPSKCSLICSEHFSELDIDRTSRFRVFLDRYAVPSIFKTSSPKHPQTIRKDHFEHSQFENNRADGKRKLKPNAIPTLFDISCPPQQLASQQVKDIGIPNKKDTTNKPLKKKIQEAEAQAAKGGKVVSKKGKSVKKLNYSKALSKNQVDYSIIEKGLRLPGNEDIIKGKPSSDPDHPDWIPSIFPFTPRNAALEERKLARYRRLRDRRETTQKGEGQFLNRNNDEPGSSKSKKPKIEKPSDSESTETDENGEDIGSSSDHDNPKKDPDYDPNKDPDYDHLPTPEYNPTTSSFSPPPSCSIPRIEFVLQGERTVDVNYFVSCLRRANKHHKTLPCGLSNMVICEEKTRGALNGIILRCKVCMTNVCVWLEDPYKVALKVATSQKAKMEADTKIRNELYAMSGIKDFLSPKTILPTKMPIPRKPPPAVTFVGQVPSSLIGYPQVGALNETISPNSGSSLSKESGNSSFTKPAFIESKFCVEPSQSKTKQKNVSVSSSDGSSTSESTDVTSYFFSQGQFPSQSVTGGSAATSSATKTAPEKILVTPDVFPHIQTNAPKPSNQKQKTQERILLVPGNVPNMRMIFQPQSTLAGKGTTALPQGILLSPSAFPLFSNMLPLRNVPSAPGTPEKTVASRSILLPSGAFAQAPSTSAQSADPGISTSIVAETITPDISSSDVTTVDLNLVKKEISESECDQPPDTVVIMTVTPDICTQDTLPVDLNLVKKEIEE